MSKKSMFKAAPLVTAIVLIGASLACLPVPTPVIAPFVESEERQTREAEDPEFATEQAQTHATQTARPDEATRQAELTKIAGMLEEDVKATAYAEEACIVKESEGYSWEHIGFEIEEGTHGTQCLYKFVIRNTSDENQNLILYERWNNKGDTGGHEWEKWNVRHFGAHASYEYRFSYKVQRRQGYLGLRYQAVGRARDTGMPLAHPG